MFEIFGLLTQPTPSVLPLLLALWPLVGALACLGDPRRARKRAIGVCASGAIVAMAVLAFATRWPGEQRFLLRHLGVAARVGQLDLVLSLGLDPLAAFASSAVFAVTALLVTRQGCEAPSARRRIGLLCIMGTTAQFAVMADGAALLLVAAGTSSLLGGALGYLRGSSFVADRIADVTLASAAAITFWTLGGSWIDDQYVPELDARVVTASAVTGPTQHHGGSDEEDEDDKPQSTPRSRGRAARATLSLTSLPSAAVLVDGAWLRTPSQSIARSPFIDVPIAAGPHTIRVHVGAGSDDYYIPRVSSVEGERVKLALRGATTTFRELEDDLVMHDALGSRDAYAALARRRFFGVSAAGLVLVFAFAAFITRARLFPFDAPRFLGEAPARSLAAIVSLVIVARYPFGAASPLTATVIACVLLLGSIMAFAGALRGRRAPALLAGELGLAGAGMVAGAPAIAMVHGTLAALLLTHSLSLPRAVSVLFFPTRVAIIGTLSALAYGAFPVAVGLAVILLGSLTIASTHPTRSRLGMSTAGITVLVLAADPRVFGFAREPLVASLLRPSFGALGPFTRCSLPLFFLVAAVHTFAWVYSRSRSYGAMGSWRVLRVLDEVGPTLSRGAYAITSATTAALFEVEARSSWVVDACDRAVRGACALLFVVDDTATSVAPARMTSLSERTTRIVLVPIALATAALFALPWLR